MADDVPTTTAPARRRPSRRALTLVGVPLAITVALGYLGDALAPSLVDTHPAWLIALNARNRNLVLVTNDMDAWSYYAIGVVRLMISDPLFFLLGYWYGDAAVAWMERRTKTWGQLLRQAEGWFGKAAHPLVFVAPNNVICLFAGAAGMSLRVLRPQPERHRRSVADPPVRRGVRGPSTASSVDRRQPHDPVADQHPALRRSVARPSGARSRSPPSPTSTTSWGRTPTATGLTAPRRGAGPRARRPRGRS